MRRAACLPLMMTILLAGCAYRSTQSVNMDPSALTGVKWLLDDSSMQSLVSDVPSGAAVTTGVRRRTGER
jgi:hypothetical protein